jgi:hypothetical protein
MARVPVGKASSPCKYRGDTISAGFTTLLVNSEMSCHCPMSSFCLDSFSIGTYLYTESKVTQITQIGAWPETNSVKTQTGRREAHCNLPNAIQVTGLQNPKGKIQKTRTSTDVIRPREPNPANIGTQR